MVVLPTLFLSQTDPPHGHRAVYRQDSFPADPPLRVNPCRFGRLLAQVALERPIEPMWAPDMIEVFIQLGVQYPDVAGEMMRGSLMPNPSCRD